MIISNKTIIEGQSGIDRATLFTLNNNIKCGGFCPQGRLAENGIIDNKYPLSETLSSIYQERTRLNIEQSDAVLVIYKKDLGKGTKLALDITDKLGKAVFIAKLPPNDKLIDDLKSWLNKVKPTKLNIAGPRESSDKGIYDKTFNFLNQVYEIVK